MSSDDSSQRSKTFAKIGVGIYGAATNYALGKMGAPPRTPLSYLKPANLQMLRSAPPMVKLATGIGAAGLLALNKSLDKQNYNQYIAEKLNKWLNSGGEIMNKLEQASY